MFDWGWSMFSFLAWLNVILLAIVISPYILVFINKKLIKTKNVSFKKLVKLSRKLHKPLALILLLTAVIHGYLGLGRIALHTGSVLYLVILTTVILGIIFYKIKKRQLFAWHKRLAFLSVAFLFLHIFFPNAIWQLIN